MDKTQHGDANDNGNRDATSLEGENMKLSPEEQSWTDQGNAAAQKEDYESAAEAFERAVEVNPDNARSRYNLALAQQFLNNAELAVAGYRRAIDLDPGLIEAYINLGTLYGELGMNEEALETFQQALDLAPEDDELYLNVGDTYREQKLFQ